MKNPIGRVIATEKVPTTMDKFTFWTDADLKLHAFDIVKVKHIDDSYSFGVIENTCLKFLLNTEMLEKPQS